jgi:putative ubiquitin-RnfH superfamily antitoxin RatB of RatAB toxin-antitoxin module
MIKSKLISLLPYLSLVLAFSGALYYQDMTIKRLEKNVAELNVAAGEREVTIAIQQSTLETIARDSKIMANELGIMQRAIVKNTQEFNKKRTEYDTYRGRLYEASIQRPTLIERRANAAFSDIMQDIARETDHSNDN